MQSSNNEELFIFLKLLACFLLSQNLLIALNKIFYWRIHNTFLLPQQRPATPGYVSICSFSKNTRHFTNIFDSIIRSNKEEKVHTQLQLRKRTKYIVLEYQCSTIIYIYIIIIIIIMSCRQHGYPWPSLATFPYRSSPPAGLLGYILCPHIAAVCKFGLVVLLLLGHMWGSIGVRHLRARPWFSSSVRRVWLD